MRTVLNDFGRVQKQIRNFQLKVIWIEETVLRTTVLQQNSVRIGGWFSRFCGFNSHASDLIIVLSGLRGCRLRGLNMSLCRSFNKLTVESSDGSFGEPLKVVTVERSTQKMDEKQKVR